MHELITSDRITTDTVHQHNVVNGFKDGMIVEYVGPLCRKHGTDIENNLTPEAKRKLVEVALELAKDWAGFEVEKHWDWNCVYWGVTVVFRKVPA